VSADAVGAVLAFVDELLLPFPSLLLPSHRAGPPPLGVLDVFVPPIAAKQHRLIAVMLEIAEHPARSAFVALGPPESRVMHRPPPLPVGAALEILGALPFHEDRLLAPARNVGHHEVHLVLSLIVIDP